MSIADNYDKVMEQRERKITELKKLVDNLETDNYVLETSNEYLEEKYEARNAENLRLISTIADLRNELQDYKGSEAYWKKRAEEAESYNKDISYPEVNIIKDENFSINKEDK